MKKKNIKKIIAGVISSICIILCFYIAISVIVASKEDRPPRVFGVSISYVPTASMEPTIDAGDYVMYKKANFNDVDVNDIIVYKNDEGRYIIHRVIEKYSDYLITKGDNNPTEDDIKITKDMVYGKYIDKVGILSIFSGGISRNMVFLLIAILFLLMIGAQVVSLVVKQKTAQIKKETDENKKIMLEEMRNEILKEELEKLKNQNNNNKNQE